MAYRWTVIGVVVLLLLVGFQGERNAAFAQRPDKDWICKVISVQGRVLVKRQGEAGWQAVGLNDALSAGDQIRVEANSRAGIVLSNDAVLRLDQNTTLVLTEIEKETTFIFKLLRGAANFFSRRARSLKIFTPFVNGVVEGTEFYVRVDAEKTRIDLFEGRILAQNPYGELHLVKGQGATAKAGSAPQSRLLVKPRDSVQWALYYPPILALEPGDMPAELKDALEAYRQGRRLKALSDLEQIEPEGRNSGFYTFRAAMLLHQGSISQARNDIVQALALDPENSEAFALRAVIAVVQNRNEEAMGIALNAVQLNPDSAAAQLALSYAYQAAFDLPNALKAAKAALAHVPENGTAHARLAELRLSTGRMDEGIQSARKAVALNPNVSHAHTMLGFAYLTQIKIARACEAFEKAIALDSAAPLPRLGFGLAKIRNGELAPGRSEIEIAAGLDPLNALMRSYLGKAYFDEKRGPLDETQFEIAKALDPNDPTPWFYNAIRKQSLNRPVEALQDLQESIKRNDNRAVYRSRLLLDEDLAARSASIGRIYSNLDFEEIALRSGWDSLNTDPSNHSAHRLLADVYYARPRHDIARVSELLQAQLYQPLNLTPVKPQLAESNLIIPLDTGISEISFNEFNPLFTGNRIAFQANGVEGTQNTRGEDLTLAGLHNWVSYSIGQYHFETDGFRENNDLTQDIYDVFVQTRISDKASMQLEYRYKDTENGDLLQGFELEDFEDALREKREERIPRLGFHYAPTASQHAILSVIMNKTDFRSHSVFEEGPLKETTDRKDDIDAYNAEGQYLLKYNRFNVIMGAGHYVNDAQADLEINATFFGFPDPPFVDSREIEIRHSNAYVYTTITPTSNLKSTIGLSGDWFKRDDLDIDQLNPKFGLSWQPVSQATLRIGAYRTLKRSLVTNQTIEPTQVAGFNQFFDDPLATDAKRWGAGIDGRLSSNLFAGAESTIGYLSIPIQNLTTGNVRREDQDEINARLYLYWLPTDRIAVNLDYRYEFYAQDPLLPSNIPKELRTHYIPLGVSYFHPSGFFAKLKGQYIYQQVEQFIPFSSSTEKKEDNFTVFDASIGYRLPRRLGIISISSTNLCDTNFNFFDANFSTGRAESPTLRPERQVLLKATLAF